MKFIKKMIRTKKHESVALYIPVEIPVQLRYMLAADGRRIILANSVSFAFLKEIFLIATQMIDDPVLFYLPDRSAENERFQKWFELGHFHLDFVVSNYYSFATKPKYMKEIIEKSKNVVGEEITLSAKEQNYHDLPHWELDNAVHFKTYSRYLLCAASTIGLKALAREAERFTGFEEEETYQCDDHTHLCLYTNEEEVDTDFWYFHQEIVE